MAIQFYRQNDAYGCFSNFWDKHPVEIDGIVWRSTEHYYQAMKFASHPEVQEQIRGVKWAGDAWKLANRNFRHLVDPDWREKKESIMLKALRAKFFQHPELADVLLSTWDESIVEHSANDSFWADAEDGSGRNRLGELLMQVRSELRQQG
jgi:ribA/ribD-fused uncharacterized protein